MSSSSTASELEDLSVLEHEPRVLEHELSAVELGFKFRASLGLSVRAGGPKFTRGISSVCANVF